MNGVDIFRQACHVEDQSEAHRSNHGDSYCSFVGHPAVVRMIPCKKKERQEIFNEVGRSMSHILQGIKKMVGGKNSAILSTRRGQELLLANFEAFRNRIKHSFECLIRLLKPLIIIEEIQNKIKVHQIL